jgi:hypothetical protein
MGIILFVDTLDWCTFMYIPLYLFLILYNKFNIDDHLYFLLNFLYLFWILVLNKNKTHIEA